MIKTVFLGTGHYIPSKLVTNHDLAKIMDTSDEWIQQRTGIQQRYYVDFENEAMGASDLGTKAALDAIKTANVEPSDIDLVVYATLSPDHPFPGDGVFLQVKAGIPAGVPCLDIRNQCTGFIYGLSVCDAMIKTGQYKKVLLVGSEVHSSGLDFSDRGRDVAVLFGDGAAACVLGAEEQDADADQASGILRSELFADGNHAEALWIEYPSSKHKPRGTKAMLDEDGWYPRMQGRLVFKEAVTKLPDAVNNLLEKLELSIEQVDWLIPHQANYRINESVQKRLGIAPEKVVHNIQRYGNTTAASIPLALDETVKAGKIKKGDLIVFAAFGAGFTWAVSAVRW